MRGLRSSRSPSWRTGSDPDPLEPESSAVGNFEAPQASWPDVRATAGPELRPPDAEAIELEDDPAPGSDLDPADAERHRRDQRDRRLIRRMRAGDDRAFEELVRQYQDRIFGLVLRMIGNRQEAEDLAQEVFITVHRAIGSYRGEGRFYTWLYRIATNTCKNRIKYLRGRNFHRSVPVEESVDMRPHTGDQGPTVPLQGRIDGPEAMAEGNRLQAAIARELAELDPEHRLLIVLRDIEGLSYHEMLRVTGLQEGTLKSRLHRARVALKDRLKSHLG